MSTSETSLLVSYFLQINFKKNLAKLLVEIYRRVDRNMTFLSYGTLFIPVLCSYCNYLCSVK